MVTGFASFCIASLCDVASKTRATFSDNEKQNKNHDIHARISPRLAPATCNCF